ncbi:MAG: Holliday junction resolvase RuvX [Candidatus Kerfeldbacteria bacterium]|nr:Holliday junction resolvase RuvX [Candidatus Kerfeldbacteria bacterium]
MSKVLALDFGTKRCGVAISDEERRWAFAREILDASSRLRLVENVQRLVSDEQVGEIVIGKPSSQEGHPTEMTSAVEEFVAMLKKQISVPVILVDERLSTKFASRILRLSERTSKTSSAEDSIAAATLLQNYLDQRV